MSAQPRRAATVLVLRDGPGIEVLLIRRSRALAFMADSYAFPGGRVEDDDRTDGEGLATAVAAVREVREEVGLALPGPQALCPFSRWVTPSVEARRYDTDFFLAALPPGQAAHAADGGQEVAEVLWLAPGEALRRFAAGTLKLPPPTLANLEDLEEQIDRIQHSGGPATVAGLLAACAGRCLVPVRPKLVPHGEGMAVVMPWHPTFAGLPGEGEVLPAPGRGPRTGRVLLTPEGHWCAG